MSPSSSRFVWYELMTTDSAAAARFYCDVVGWTAQRAPMGGMDYTLFDAGTTQVAGAFNLSKEQVAGGAPCAWIGYIGVADVDRSAADVRAVGGQVWRGPDDIPDVGRFATVSDSQGAAFALFHSARSDDASPADPGAPGHVGWHELYAGDGAKAFDFYAKLFGWHRGETMDMGPAGKYQMFGLSPTSMMGGMMTKPAMMPVPAWTFYFNVGGIDDAAGRVKRGGGQIANGPQEVPGGQWVVQAIDPQGAHFALLGAK
jgi:uncharacterized protein